MDQQKIGQFLKQLRNEKGLTQAELAEKFYTSSRTISRWETGKIIPDLTTLIELAEFYDVGIDELIDGERCDNREMLSHQDTLKKVAEYSKTDKEQAKRKIVRSLSLDLAIVVSLLFFYILFAPKEITGVLSDILPQNLYFIIPCIFIIVLLISNITFVRSTIDVLEDENNTTSPVFIKINSIGGYLLIAYSFFLILTFSFDFILPIPFYIIHGILIMSFGLFTTTVCAIKAYKAYKQGKIEFWDLF